MISEKTIPPRNGSGFRIRNGQYLEVIDPEGMQVSDLFCFNAHDIEECFSASRSMDYAERLLLSAGDVLYSNRSRKMLTLLRDSCGRHDLLMPPCSLRMFQIVAGDDEYHPSCHENLSRAFQAFAIPADRVGTTLNLFMNVVFDETGNVRILPPLSKAGDTVLLRAEMDLFVALTACSHEESNGGRCKPIRYRIFNDLAEASIRD